jgi:uncharacterized phage infection (PIP) family protein YhgE
MLDCVQAISGVLPLTYFNDGMRDAVVFGNVGAALTNLLIVSVLAAVTFTATAHLVRWRSE